MWHLISPSRVDCTLFRLNSLFVKANFLFLLFGLFIENTCGLHGSSSYFCSVLRLKWELGHVVVLTHELDGGLLWVSDLEHRVRKWLHFLLALLAQVVVISDWALVSDPCDRPLVTPIANDSVVDDLSLSLLLLLEVLGEQFLILTGAVFADFFS